MPKNAMRTCEEIILFIDENAEEGTAIFNRALLERGIKSRAGLSKQTVKRYVEYLLEMGYITPKNNGYAITEAGGIAAGLISIEVEGTDGA